MFKAAYSYKENGKWTYKVVQVYDVSYDKHGYPLFLIYFKGQWLRRSGKKSESLFYSRTFQSITCVIHSAHAFVRTKLT